MSVQIHPTAIVDSKAQLGSDVSIGPFSILGPEVVIGDRTAIENNVVIKGKTEIGTDNIISSFTTIGLPAQDRNHRNEDDVGVKIGSQNEIREHVTIHCGTRGGPHGGFTIVGDDNQIMVGCHLGHDSGVGSHCTFANDTKLGGHSQLGSYIVTGAIVGFHQFCRIGDYVMIGGLSGIVQDVAPYLLISGQRAKVYGINRTGLSRNGFSHDEIHQVKKLHQIFFKKGFSQKDAIEHVSQAQLDEKILQPFLDFVTNSTRGILR